MRYVLAGTLFAAGILLALYTIFIVGASSLSWDAILITVSDGLISAGVAVVAGTVPAFIAGPVFAVIEAIAVFGLPPFHW